jgi:hypothetical protein
MRLARWRCESKLICVTKFAGLGVGATSFGSLYPILHVAIGFHTFDYAFFFFSLLSNWGHAVPPLAILGVQCSTIAEQSVRMSFAVCVIAPEGGSQRTDPFK